MHHKSTPAVGPLPGWTAPARALLVAFCLLMLAVGPSLAIELFPPESEFRGNFNTTLSIGAAMRVADQDPQLIGVTNGGEAYSINGDNGNLNYENGDVVSATAKATHELSLRYRNLSAFARGFYFYDAAIMNMETARTEMSSDAEDEIGRDFTLLDAYLAVDVPLGGMGFTLRGGNQVLSWGEGTVIQNGINTISPIDVSKLRVAGAELREGLTAVPMIDVNLGLGERFSVEGFYELMWDHTEIEPEGTFFSTNDFASPGGEYLFLGFGVDTLVSDNPPTIAGGKPPVGTTVPRADDRDAEDDGQFGVALRWFEPWLNDTEFALYFTRLHSRLPLLSACTGSLQEGLLAGDYASTCRYFREFPEDIDTYGMSFNTDLDFIGTALQAEVAYHADQPLQVDGVELVFAALSPLDPYLVQGVPTLVLFGNGQLGSYGFGEEITGYRRKDVMQAQMTLTKAVGPRLLADQVILLGEFGGTFIRDMEDEEEFRYESPGTNTSGNDFFTNPYLPTDPPMPLPKIQPATQEDGFPTDVSWGYRLIVRADFNNAIGPVNLRPGLAFEHDVSGTTPMPLGNFVEGRMSVTASLSASLLMSWGAELAYTNSFGGDEFNDRNDRDFVTFTINYSF